ncbi:amidohydrolase [Balneolaceae bacterium YR4-1]|uniref:Amidohydrolase n=1 Tax=Halalkalibaculum roseum TaxID=2709311 RepID=A0A6M1T3B4_9BACT|nr:amidohydrolase [Halalkalibaculum roseum]NGP77227.1 amidohydrolase [Halalkalibaculum roseum]
MRFYTFLITLTIFALGMAACSQKSPDTTVYENIDGYTFSNGELATFSSIAFQEGKVVKTANEGSLAGEYPDARVLDGEGNVMLPGLIDAHGHVMGLGFQELDVDVAGAGSLDSTLQMIGDYAEQYPDREWILGRGWNHTRWDINRFPTAEELDGAVTERPVWLSRVDGHAGWANSKAMELAGITADTEDPQGGKIIRDEDGNPTGVFVDAAMGLVESEVPARTEREREMALEKALQQMSSHGLTGVHDAGISVDDWNLYKNFADNGNMITRIYAMIGGAGDTFDQLSENGPITSYAEDKLALRSVKLYSDGALGSRGAAMIESYSDDPGNRGLLFASEEEMTDMIMKTASEGFQTNVHAIGDRANRVVLDAFANVKDSLGEQGLRHRIEHAQIVSLEDIPRFKELNIIASMQPTHATSDMNMAEDRVGSERIEGGYAWKTFLEQGTVLASGSDFPVENVNPFFGLYSAITRQDHQGNPEGGWHPNEAISRENALRSFTIDAAYAAHQEDILGSLEPGKWADFILIDRNYMEISREEIWQTKVLETWVAGEKVYSAEQ